MTALTPPRVLTIAGSDSGGGAGIQADLKTFAAHGVYGMSVVTAITAQNTCEVTAIETISPAVVAAQIDAVFDDIGVDAVKIGMLASAAIVEVVASRLAVHRPEVVVLDPVMIAKSGDALLQDDAVAALRDQLFPLASLLTPNLPEAERLTGLGAASEADCLAAARQLAQHGAAVLIKGGHRVGPESVGPESVGPESVGPEIVDLLLDGQGVKRYRHPRQATTSTHGTGCTLSSAIAARLGAGANLRSAVAGAIDYLQGAIASAFPLGAGHGPVHHLYRLAEVPE